MEFLSRQFLRFWARLRSLGRRTCIGAAVLLLAAVGGGIWLWRAASGPGMVPLTGTSLSPRELAGARAALRSQGIPHRVRAGRLLVPRQFYQRASSAVGQGQPAAGNLSASLERLAGQNDIWSTDAQKARRWQAAKMAMLGQLIQAFPAVRSATVLLEPGSRRGLASLAVRPTAAVNVVFEPGATMTRELVAAIADQVAASVAGMQRQDVRIVDSAGRSYRSREEDPAVRDALARLVAAERYYAEKVRRTLSYIHGVAVGVRAACEAKGIRCLGASVTLPRSYLAALYKAQHPGEVEPSDETIRPFAAAHLPRLQKQVMRVIGCKDAGAVTVDWHHDVAVVPTGAAAAHGRAPTEKAARGGSFWAALKAWTGIGLTAACFLGVILYLRRRAARRLGAAAEGSSGLSKGPLASGKVALDGTAEPGESEPPFSFLKSIRREQVVALIEEEHPQTIALVLAHLKPGRSAGILAALPPAKQVEVVQRLAELGPVDQDLLQEVQRSLAGRLVEKASPGEGKVGGVPKIAEILHHAGYATESRVLEGLSGEQPELAESIRNRMFVFEDIASMPVDRLGAAMEALGSEELAIALRTAGAGLMKKVFASLSAATLREVRDEMERIGPVRLSDVEAAQQRVMDAIRRAERGEYVGESQEKQKEVMA